MLMTSSADLELRVWRLATDDVSLVHFSYSSYVSRSLTHNNYIETISVFSRPENSPSVSDVVLISGGRLFHANRVV